MGLVRHLEGRHTHKPAHRAAPSHRTYGSGYGMNNNQNSYLYSSCFPI
jgi:hypothetical protein